jgi:hypothetical protein
MRKKVMPSVAKQLSEREIEEEYNINARTLQGWRTRKKGPPHRKVAGTLVRYDRAEFEQWLEASPRFPCQQGHAGTDALLRESSDRRELNSRASRRSRSRKTGCPSTQ